MDYDWRTQPGLTAEQREAAGRWFEEHPDAEDPCCDNYRVAIVGNAESVSRYEEARATGCCGFADSEIQVGGVTLLVGFNYGH